MKRIIGIDPGLVHTGWGIIETAGNNRKYIASGVIDAPVKDSLPDRLHFIFSELEKVIAEFSPTVMAIEITFVNKNPQTSLLLGHARAAAILPFAARDIPVFEYEANKIKRAISATGHADKDQVARMIKILLPTAAPKKPDEADALAVALAHSNLI